MGALRHLTSVTAFVHVRSAVAYASMKGCTEFSQAISGASKYWKAAKKEWLISVDFGQTSPDAIELLAQLPNSVVRIADGRAVLEYNLVPARSFHPKAFVFTDSAKRPCSEVAILHGSANLTFAALHLNAEQVSAVRLWGKPTKSDKSVHDALERFDEWWNAAWAGATHPNDAFLKEYRAVYDPAPHLQDRERLSETLSADDTEVGLEEGTRWSVARCFWIETYELYKNRGKDQPGNQLDCRRGTRVFFGFPSKTVPKDTSFGEVQIRYEGKEAQMRSVRYGNNAMDKVNLPVPGEYGPENYDNAVLHFERLAPGQFVLGLGTKVQARLWRKRSEQQGLAYQLSGGRRYGFYS